MEKKSMTALISAFARAYHSENNNVKIFDDFYARSILSDEEYYGISKHMSEGVGFFFPDFKGSLDDGLKLVVDNYLSPSPLGRALFAEKALELSVRLGVKQYIILAAGYDTFAYRSPDWSSELQIFEVDHPLTSQDKERRLSEGNIEISDSTNFIKADLTDDGWTKKLLSHNSFNKESLSFTSILGLSYYLSKEHFKTLLKSISNLIVEGSSIVFDYPDKDTFTDLAGERAKRQLMMAKGTGEPMINGYSYEDMEEMLSDCGLLIYEHLTPQEITEQYFNVYNSSNPSSMITAFDNVNYCLAVKKGKF